MVASSCFIVYNTFKFDCILLTCSFTLFTRFTSELKDLLIFHVDEEEDIKLAEEIRERILKECVKNPPVSVDVSGHVGIGRLHLSLIDLMVSDYRWILLLVTPSFTEDHVGQVQVHGALYTRLCDKKEQYRI